VAFEWTDAQQTSFNKLKAALTSNSVLTHPRFDQPFIMSCDASNYAISAISSQLQHGTERPVSFASRMLNAAERNYSTTQKELLAVVFRTQVHRCFLYGRKFKIVTDHAALKWLIAVKNYQCARLTTWVLKLAKYEFEIEHKAGRKHVNADCLSRHIATLRPEPETQNKPRGDTEVELTRENVLSEQQKYSYCKKLIEQIKLGQETEVVISNDGLLYHGQTLDEAKLIVPKTLILRIIKMHHDKVFAGHQGILRTRDLLKLYYFWPTLNRDVERYVKECDSCAKFKVGRNPSAPLGQLPETTVPFEQTSMDICGPYPETRLGNRYLLTFMDHFTRYPEAIPIPRQDAPTAAGALVTEIFWRLGCPQTISSDKGSNFMSELFQEMCKLMNSTSFNPQMQGKVEKFHFGRIQTMSHNVNKYGNDWDEFVNYALMAHRAVPHSVTKYSPFYLLHGRQIRFPTEDDLTGRKCVDETRNFYGHLIQTHLDSLAECFEDVYAIVRENNKAGRDKQKESYDRGTKLVSFQPGDLICLREMTRCKQTCPKFRIRWKGPYEVVRRLSDSNYSIKLSMNKEIVVNVNKMKKCFRESFRRPPPRKGRNVEERM
jgi:transposase InsO family protein